MKKAFLLLSLCIGILSACKTSKTANSDETNTATANDFTIPNSFTPIGDGKNDVACFVTEQKDLKGKITVYTRWGNALWESKSINDCWDGTSSATHEPSPSGVYFVKIEVNGAVLKTGNITLIR